MAKRWRVETSLKGDRALAARYRAGDARVRQFAEAALRAWAEDVRTASAALAPRMDSVLVNSAYVEVTTHRVSLIARIGYSAVYAATVHENPRAGKTGGVSPSGQPYRKWAQVGQWKFLEQPFVQMRGEAMRALADALVAAFR